MTHEILQFFDGMTQDAVTDKPDARDYQFGEVFGAVQLPSRVVWDHTKAYNQNLPNNPSTKYACVFYTANGIVNEENREEFRSSGILESFKELDPVDLTREALKRNLLSIDSGAFIQSGPKLAMDLGYISGYTLPKTVDEIKQAIFMGQLVQFGTRWIDWKKTLTNPNHIIIPGKCYGHSMFFEGYDDNLHGGCFIERNSIGEEFGPFRGRQFLKYTDLEAVAFGSRYAYVDKKNDKIIMEVQSQRRRKEALDKGHWNGMNADKFATRFEVSAVAGRIGTNTPVWNGQNPNVLVTRSELKAMFERATGRKFNFSIFTETTRNIPITRGEMAELSVRI